MQLFRGSDSQCKSNWICSIAASGRKQATPRGIFEGRGALIAQSRLKKRAVPYPRPPGARAAADDEHAGKRPTTAAPAVGDGLQQLLQSQEGAIE
jgi:hypothetical protein